MKKFKEFRNLYLLAGDISITFQESAKDAAVRLEKSGRYCHADFGSSHL